MTEDDKQTDKTDDKGNKDNSDSKDDKPKEDITEFQKLKASNDEFEKELVRGRELKKESQELEAQKMLSSSAGGHVKPHPG